MSSTSSAVSSLSYVFHLLLHILLLSPVRAVRMEQRIHFEESEDFNVRISSYHSDMKQGWFSSLTRVSLRIKRKYLSPLNIRIRIYI